MSETPRTDEAVKNKNGDIQEWMINAFEVCAELERELTAAHQRIAELENDNARMIDALEFYANPETYHACAFLFDPPTGGFDKDFDDGHNGYDRPMPGKLARQAIGADMKGEQ